MSTKTLCLFLVGLVLLAWTPFVESKAANIAAVSSPGPFGLGDKDYLSKDLSDDTSFITKSNNLPTEAVIEDDKDEVVRDKHDVLTGFPLDDLDDDGLQALMDIDDDTFFGQAGEHLAKKLLLADKKVNRGSSLGAPGALSRRKRLGPVIARAALAGARALFQNFARSGVTRSGARVTRHYDGRGNYNDALRHFQNLRPDNVRPFQSGRISGQTGTVGNHRVTVRDGSSSGRPTLEVRSHNGQVVRKFRFNE